MAVSVTVFSPGEVLRCVNRLPTGNPCRKQFGIAVQTCAVAVVSVQSRGDMIHRCRECRAELAVYLGAVWSGRAA